MTKRIQCLAVDLGAESGRCVVGTFDGQHLHTQEVHRFANAPVRTLETEHWNVLGLFEEVKAGLGHARVKSGDPIATVGIDTWGLDFALLARDGTLLGNPHTYRDPRTQGVMGRALKRIPREQIFVTTGIQFMEINTLYQLMAAAESTPDLLDQTETFLMVPDLFNYWLTGERVCEWTDATTSQCVDPRRRAWATDLLATLGIPTHFFPPLVTPGSVVGPLLPKVAAEMGLVPAVRIVAPACHDTGSAVVGVPCGGREFAYISSGTWSLVGVEVGEPVLTEVALQRNFSNEGGVCGTFRLLRNVMGLWLLQGCRRAWGEGGCLPLYETLLKEAESAPPLGPIVDPDDGTFLRAMDMPTAIQGYLIRTGQAAPPTRGGIVRCVLESLALKYRWVIEGLERVTGQPLSTIHIVGGGAQNRLLCQLTANTTGRTVVAGPAEATAVGNLGMQLMALGEVGSLADFRAVVRCSFELRAYEPTDVAAWDEAYARFVRTTGLQDD